MRITFTVYARVLPQGSSKAFMVRGRPIITSATKGLKPFRNQVAEVALCEMKAKNLEIIPKKTGVALEIKFYLKKPDSTPKRQIHLVTRPDIDKCLRSCFDALTGIVWEDDSQVCQVYSSKLYGSPERIEFDITSDPLALDIANARSFDAPLFQTA